MHCIKASILVTRRCCPTSLIGSVLAAKEMVHAVCFFPCYRAVLSLSGTHHITPPFPHITLKDLVASVPSRLITRQKYPHSMIFFSRQNRSFREQRVCLSLC